MTTAYMFADRVASRFTNSPLWTASCTDCGGHRGGVYRFGRHCVCSDCLPFYVGDAEDDEHIDLPMPVCSDCGKECYTFVEIDGQRFCEKCTARRCE